MSAGELNERDVQAQRLADEYGGCIRIYEQRIIRDRTALHSWVLWSREWVASEVTDNRGWQTTWYCTRCRSILEEL